MAAVAVVSVLLVIGIAYGRDEHSRESVTRGLLHLDFLYPGRKVRQDHGFSKDEREKEDRSGAKIKHTVLPVFIPVRYDLRKHSPLERRVTEDDSVSPRLVMDEDFNIKFDNPYIVPLTKPLAFILNSDAHARENRPEDDEKLMVPFPVLVKAREGKGDCRDDDVLEHRTNYDDHYGDDDDDDRNFKNENPPHYRKVNPNYRYLKNGTTTFHKTNSPTGRHYPTRAKNYPEPTYYKSGIPPERNYEYNHNSSREYQSLDVYPSKIFADMYRSIPKHALESEESQETDDYFQYDKRRHAEHSNQKIKPSSRHPYRGHAFSASTDLHWVTNGNLTKTKKTNEELSNIVIYDVTEPPEPKATVATSTTTTDRPETDAVWGMKI